MINKQLIDSQAPVGTGVIVTHRQNVLFGQRVTTEGNYEWQLPGGWVEPGESPEQAARREVIEETGLTLGGLKLVAITNNKFSQQNHSISLYFEAECLNPEQVNIFEPGKCKEWKWMRWQELENNLYLPLQLLKDTDYRPFFPDKREIHVSF